MREKQHWKPLTLRERISNVVHTIVLAPRLIATAKQNARDAQAIAEGRNPFA